MESLIGNSPAPGSVDAANDATNTISRLSQSLSDLENRLKSAGTVQNWEGEAADGFSRRIDQHKQGTGAAKAKLDGMVSILTQWTTSLAEFQRQAATLEQQATELQGSSDNRSALDTLTDQANQLLQAHQERGRELAQKFAQQQQEGFWTGLLHDFLNIEAVPPYALYYAAYHIRKAEPGWLRSIDPITPSVEATGLLGDIGLDWLKNKLVHNGESIADEGKIGSILPNPFAKWFPGLNTYLPGVHPDGKVDFER